MEIKELRNLVLLAELGNLARVAQRLHVTAPAAFKQLKGLEAELGVRLYEKYGRSLRLTQAADILLPYARDVLAQHDAGVQALQEWRGLRRGLVRIGTGPTLSSYVLTELLKRYRRAHPTVALELETGNSITLVDALKHGRLDLALLVASQAPEDRELKIEVSWPVEYVLVTSLAEVPKRCSIAELREFPFILFRSGSRIENLIDRYFAEVRFEPTVYMTFDNAEAIKAMIRTGFGMAMLPYWIVDADLRNGALRMIRPKERPLVSRIDLVARKCGYVPAPTASFIEMARKFKLRNPRLVSGGAAANGHWRSPAKNASTRSPYA
jgi:DNA-binding transcriptional LysR family regulator